MPRAWLLAARRRGVRDNPGGHPDLHLRAAGRDAARAHREAGERDQPRREPVPAARGAGVRVERGVRPRRGKHAGDAAAPAGGGADQRCRPPRWRADAGRRPVGGPGGEPRATGRRGPGRRAGRGGPRGAGLGRIGAGAGDVRPRAGEGARGGALRDGGPGRGGPPDRARLDLDGRRSGPGGEAEDHDRRSPRALRAPRAVPG